ncbi:uncharacterized protein B0I36DRAFT_60925 [Microdochium trichocladiopsis]|uniref:Uncharacterized protein n=1 Tax=Microdochium trichocladiopsis TaxID=1682393 RepID=A0A9P8XR14_9PEZI|nr:uncharacterized protein B0I36DRAFT_60925 [Microdochium trichocladiopsis]KAH7009272.1 hypothetical protein B0I36DRAFT_60925 [Microdochium trichocladiopsis]
MTEETHGLTCGWSRVRNGRPVLAVGGDSDWAGDAWPRYEPGWRPGPRRRLCGARAGKRAAEPALTRVDGSWREAGERRTEDWPEAGKRRWAHTAAVEAGGLPAGGGCRRRAWQQAAQRRKCLGTEGLRERGTETRIATIANVRGHLQAGRHVLGTR